MDKLAAVIAVPEQVTISTGTYTVHPLTLRDFAFLERWMRQETINAGKLELDDRALSAMDKSIIMQQAYKQANTLGFMSPAGEAMLCSIGGMLQIAFHSLRKGMPGLTVERVGELLATVDDATEIMTTAMRLSGIESDDDDAKPDGDGDDAKPDSDGDASDPTKP